MNTYTYTTQTQIRKAFREQFPHLDFSRHSKNESYRYCADTRMAFGDFIESLARNNQISESLANRATL